MMKNMTKEDLDRAIISFMAVFAAILIMILAFKLGAADRRVNELTERISSMEAAK